MADAMDTHFINAYVSSCETECDDGTLDANEIFQSIYMLPTDPVEISNVIKQLRANVAPGIDEICPAEIKSVAPLICGVRSHIVNLSLEKGVCRSQLNRAKGTAIYQGHDVNNLSNYRLISALSTIPKIFEAVIYEFLGII